MSAQAANPVCTMPRALALTLLLTAVLSGAAAVALCGMVHYTHMHAGFGFASALRAHGADWAATVVEVGELITLVAVVLVSFLAQPHLQAALARDGLLPTAFAVEDTRGVLRTNLLVTGVALSLVAAAVPFAQLNDLINAGVLLSLNMTNACVVLLRRRTAAASSSFAVSPSQLLAAYVALAAAAAFALVKLPPALPGKTGLVLTLAGAAVTALVALARLHPAAETSLAVQASIFTVPGEPWVPALAIALNFFLVAQARLRLAAFIRPAVSS
jgi:amino acid transporter